MARHARSKDHRVEPRLSVVCNRTDDDQGETMIAGSAMTRMVPTNDELRILEICNGCGLELCIVAEDDHKLIKDLLRVYPVSQGRCRQRLLSMRRSRELGAGLGQFVLERFNLALKLVDAHVALDDRGWQI